MKYITNFVYLILLPNPSIWNKIVFLPSIGCHQKASNTGICLWNLWNLQEYLFYRLHPEFLKLAVLVEEDYIWKYLTIFIFISDLSLSNPKILRPYTQKTKYYKKLHLIYSLAINKLLAYKLWGLGDLRRNFMKGSKNLLKKFALNLNVY